MKKLFAVLIAFVLINQFTEVNSARTGSYQEAASVVAVYWDADLLTPSARDEIRRTVLTYRTCSRPMWWTPITSSSVSRTPMES